ncbi:cobalamin biosynthesis protein CobD [bacterium]|nr:MAG: cobalamin biosynthesis protein CobD [bacterium]
MIFTSANYLFLAIVLFAAYILDLAIGDPRWLPHPIRLIGCFIVFFEGVLRRASASPGVQRFCGALLTVLVVGLSYVLTALFLYIASGISEYLFFALSVYVAWSCLAIKSLKKEAEGVLRALKEQGIADARQRLKRIVGRDTQNLSKVDVLRATAETVAENTSDGVVAPLFYFMLGGPALMLAYKAINTLDSMVGYKNEKYRYFGTASARLDDIVNYVPARLSAALMVLAVFILGYNWKGSLKTVLSDGKNHPSPNSGVPESAVAGAFGLRFGGPSSYGGVVSQKPFIGNGAAESSVETTSATVKIMELTAFLMVIAVIAVKLLCR